MIPMFTKELKSGDYEISKDVSAKKDIGLCFELGKLFGYDNLERLRAGIESKLYILRAKFDNGKTAYCASRYLMFSVPKEANRLVSISITQTTDLERLVLDLSEMIQSGVSPREYSVLEGKIGVIIVMKERGAMLVEEISKKLGISKENLVIESGMKEGPDILIKTKEGKNVAIGEVKSTIIPERFEDQMNEAINDIRRKYFPDPEYKDIRYGYAIAINYDPREFITSDIIGRIEIKLLENL